MNISLKKMDAVYAILKMEIEKNDYAEQVDKNLRKIRQKVNMPGFRQGMVPFGIVNKLYGKQSLVEEINKLVSDRLYSYLRDNQILFLGEPMPNETEQKAIDFDTDENFEFSFDIAIAPVVDVQISKADKLTSYNVVIEDEVVDKQVTYYQQSFGSVDKVETVETEDLIKGTLVELEEGKPKEGGIVVEDALLMPLYLKGKLEQKKFLKAKVGDGIVFNPHKAYKGAETELAALLKINKEEVKKMKSDFSFEIKEITRNKPAELNQELFDKSFGENVVKNETEFREAIKETLRRQYDSQVINGRNKAFRDLVLSKTENMAFADDVLKRWMLASNENMTQESIENEYPKIIEDLKYRLVKEKLVKDLDIQVNNEDIESMAKRIVQMQFAQYGMASVPDEIVETQAKELLSKKETVNRILESVMEEKLSDRIKDLVTVEEQEVTTEAYHKIIEEKK